MIISTEEIIALLMYGPGILFSIILGLGFGSYATMAVYRLPRGEPWIGLKPRCLACEHVLLLSDFFPIVSWFRRSSGCKYCGAPIELKTVYVWVEVAVLLLCIASFLTFGFSEIYLLMIGLSIALVVLVAADIDMAIIPNTVLTTLLVLGVAYRLIQESTIYAILIPAMIALVVGTIVRYSYYRSKGEEEVATDFMCHGTHARFDGPGFSYVKLYTILAIWVGVEQLGLMTAIAAAGYSISYYTSTKRPALALSTAALLVLFS